MTGTSVYLDILRKTTTTHSIKETKYIDDDGNVEKNSTANFCNNEVSEEDRKLRLVAEEKLVSFCEQILKDASEMHSSKDDSASVEIHRVLELRAPVVVKVTDVFYKIPFVSEIIIFLSFLQHAYIPILLRNGFGM